MNEDSKMKVLGPRVRDTLFHNFLGGIAWSLGLTFGFSLLIFIASLILSSLGGLPFIGDWFAGLMEVMVGSIEKRQLLN